MSTQCGTFLQQGTVTIMELSQSWNYRGAHCGDSMIVEPHWCVPCQFHNRGAMDTEVHTVPISQSWSYRGAQCQSWSHRGVAVVVVGHGAVVLVFCCCGGLMSDVAWSACNDTPALPWNLLTDVIWIGSRCDIMCWSGKPSL